MSSMHKAPSVSETCLLTNTHIYKWHADTHAHTHTHTHTHTHAQLDLSSFSDLHSHTHTHKHTRTHTPIWRGAAFRSRWRLHVSTAKGATGLQQTSVLVMVVVVLGVRDEEGRRREEEEGRGRASASAYSGGEPLPE